MSQIIDASTSLSFSSYKPVVSPTGQFIVHTNASRFILRRSDTLERIRSIDLSPSQDQNRYIKISKISWEPIYDSHSSKFAVLIDSESKIKIFDVEDETVDITIEENETFGIETFEWLSIGETQVETTYKGSKQLVVFSKNELLAQVYSLDFTSPLLTIEFPKFNKVLQNSDSNIFQIVTMKNGKNLTVLNILNEGSSSKILYKSELGSFLNIDSVKISSERDWILTNESLLQGSKVQLYSIAGSLSKDGGELLSYEDGSPLGVTHVDFATLDDEIVIIGNHFEQVLLLQIQNGLKLIQTLNHGPKIENESVWKQSNDNNKYIKKSQQSLDLPRFENLPLIDKGFIFLISQNGVVFSVTKSMPTSLFIWSLSKEKDSPETIIITNRRIKEINLHEFSNLITIVTEDSVSIWSKSIQNPISIPIPESNENKSIKNAQILHIDQKLVSVFVWFTDKTFAIIKIRTPTVNSTFKHLNDKQLETIRNGSPVLSDDLSRVVELAAGVQQSEWGQNTSKILQIEDTFQSKKRHKYINR